MNGLLNRLDRFGADDRWRKPRHGDCHLCGRPVLSHPRLAHRWRALLTLALR